MLLIYRMNKEEIVKATMIGFYNKANQASHYAIPIGKSYTPTYFPPNISITRTIYFNDKGEKIDKKNNESIYNGDLD
jgi:hypothetical protein